MLVDLLPLLVSGSGVTDHVCGGRKACHGGITNQHAGGGRSRWGKPTEFFRFVMLSMP